MSSDASIADGDLSAVSASAGHQSQSSGEFVEAPAPADDADLPADDGNDQPEDAARGYREVRVWWPQSYAHSLSLYASHNKFASPVEMEGSAEKGYSAVVRAPIGQDLVYRFEVDGEMQASDEAATMTLNGDDYNFVAVEAEGEEESAADAASATPASPPQSHRRQSSKLVWDNQRSTLVVPEDASPAKVGSRKHSVGESSPRFVGVGHTPAPVDESVLSPAADGDESDDSGDDDGTPSSSGLNRTQRKNQRHRQKQAQLKAEKAQILLTPPRPTWSVVSSGSGAPGMNSQSTLMELNKLKMRMMQRENEWKETWVAHEIQTFQQREAERTQLKNSMNEERSRWLLKLKEYTAELKELRDSNMALKAEVSAAASSKLLAKSTAKKTEKFQTLQRNMLNEEMLVWISDKNRLQGEVDQLKNEKADAEELAEELKQSLAASATQVTTLGITLQSKDREIEQLAGEKAQLIAQQQSLAASATDSSSEASSLKEALAAAQAKYSEESRVANAARQQADLLTAQVAALQAELSAKAAESESQRAAAAARLADQVSGAEKLKVEIAVLQQKLLTAQETIVTREADVEKAQIEREAAEQKAALLQSQSAERSAAYEKSLLEARAATVESGAKILALNGGIKDLRAQVSGLGELQLQQTAGFIKQLADSQTFLVDSLNVQSQLLGTTMRKLKKEMAERRKLHNQVQELRGNIRVYCRTRPITEAELADGGSAIQVPQPDSDQEVATELTLDNGKGAPKQFEFDAVFGEKSTQAEVFAQIVALVTSVLDGYACCLFAYGQTGAGKTHTMMGSAKEPGMNLRSLKELFRLREERREDVSYEISVSFYEIYNENLYDLLDTNREKELKIRQGSTGVYVEGLSSRAVQTEEDVMQLMAEGNQNRTVGSTSMNAQSSRSHSILSVHVHGHSNVMGVQLRGTLHLIDLAGSERVGRSNATGERLKEAQAINLSLSALGNVIEALQKKQAHVPFRNSKLTYILQNSLGGHSKTLMMVNCSPALRDAEETICSLQFASRVRATELGTATKNVSAAAPAEGGAASSSSSSAAGVTSPPPKRAASALTSAVKKPLSAAGAVKKPAAAAPGSAVKKALPK